MVYYKAKQLQKKYKINSKSGAEHIKHVVHKQGYNLLPYSEALLLLTALRLDKEAKTAKALSSIDQNGEVTVYFNDKLPLSIQRVAIAHELGHIELNHKHRNLRKDLQEKEADLFAKYLFEDSDNRFTVSIISLLCLFACILTALLYFIISNNIFTQTDSAASSISNNSVSMQSKAPSTVIEQSDTQVTNEQLCFFTENSEVYHLYSDCQYIRNSNNVICDTISHSHKDRLCFACERQSKK